MLRNSKFFCDEMVIRLGRWLRAAGYEVATARSGQADCVIQRTVQSQGSLLLTKDRELATQLVKTRQSFLLSGNCLSAWVKQLNQAALVDWGNRPFSRCLDCGNPVTPWNRADSSMEVPLWVLDRYGDELYQCGCCLKVYWKGSHYEKIRSQLAVWANLR